MNTCCCCFSYRAGAIFIALISMVCSIPFVNDIIQSWKNPGIFSPKPPRNNIIIQCIPPDGILRFDFTVPTIVSNDLGNIVIVLFFLCSLLLLHSAIWRKKITCLPWLWLTTICFIMHICTAVAGLVNAIFSRSCPFTERLYPIIGAVLIYAYEYHLIHSVDNFYKQLGEEINIQSDQRHIIHSNISQPVVHQPNSTVPEIVIYPNPHLDLPPSYDEIIPSAPPPD